MKIEILETITVILLVLFWWIGILTGSLSNPEITGMLILILVAILRKGKNG